MGRAPRGYDLQFGTCGWKSLVHSEIGVDIAAGKVGNPCMWCQYDDDDAPIKFTRCCAQHTLIGRSRECRLFTAVRSHGHVLTSFVTSRVSFRRREEMMRQNVVRPCLA